MVEHGRQEIAESSSCLDHAEQNQVHHQEPREYILVADDPVQHAVEDQGYEEHDGHFGEQLGRSVNPDLVETTVTFADINRLLALEHDDSRQEVQEHLEHRREVDCAGKTLNIGSSWLAHVNGLSKTGKHTHHEQCDNDCLEDLGS